MNLFFFGVLRNPVGNLSKSVVGGWTFSFGMVGSPGGGGQGNRFGELQLACFFGSEFAWKFPKKHRETWLLILFERHFFSNGNDKVLPGCFPCWFERWLIIYIYTYIPGTLNNPVFNGCFNWMTNQILWQGNDPTFHDSKIFKNRWGHPGFSRVVQISQILTDPKSDHTRGLSCYNKYWRSPSSTVFAIRRPTPPTASGE